MASSLRSSNFRRPMCRSKSCSFRWNIRLLSVNQLFSKIKGPYRQKSPLLGRDLAPLVIIFFTSLICIICAVLALKIASCSVIAQRSETLSAIGGARFSLGKALYHFLIPGSWLGRSLDNQISHGNLGANQIACWPVPLPISSTLVECFSSF